MKSLLKKVGVYVLSLSLLMGSSGMFISYSSFTFADTSEPYVEYTFGNKSDSMTDKKGHSAITYFNEAGDGNNRNNSSITFGEDSHGKHLEWKSNQSRGGGFKIQVDKELSQEYTIGVKFSFDTTQGSWRKIIDYKNSTSDSGFYFYNNGHLRFYPDSLSSTKTVASNQVVNFIIKKSATNFTVYLVGDDGVVTTEFDSTNSTTLNNAIPASVDGKTILGFFFDDIATGSEATNGGKVYSLAIYDKAIDPTKVVEKLNEEKHNVIYKAIANEGSLKTLPQEVVNQVGKSNQMEVKKGTGVNVTSVNTSAVRDEGNHGVWKFVSWDKESDTIGTEDVKFTSKWKFIEDLKFNVTYEFKSSDENKTLPEEVKNRLRGKNKENIYKGTVVDTEGLDTSDFIDSENHGKWVFNSWNTSSATVENRNIEFVGKWTFVEDEKHNVIYTAVKSEGVKADLPNKIVEQVGKSNKNNIYKNSTVNIDNVNISDFIDSDNHGIWKFISWDKTLDTMGSKDITFTSKWTFVEDAKFNVAYEFKSFDENKTLPEGLKNRLRGKNKENIYKGTAVNTDAIDTSDFIDLENHGKWVFNSWNITSVTVENDNIEFVGKWAFVEDAKFNITYEFKSSDENRELPQKIVYRLKNKNKEGAYKGEKFNIFEIDTNEFVDIENKGKWIFESWNKEKDTVDNKNIEFVGMWKFISEPEKKIEKPDNNKEVEKLSGKNIENKADKKASKNNNLKKIVKNVPKTSDEKNIFLLVISCLYSALTILFIKKKKQ